MSAGPVIIDVAGFSLTATERTRLRDPAVGGVIFFARNFQSPAQLRELVAAMRSLRSDLLLCVDHEGGRVQRFREGFSAIPPMRRLGELWDRGPEEGIAAARAAGLVIATELRAHGLDFSFTPVLDLDYGQAAVIGDRALHTRPNAVGALGAALIRGLAEGGIAAVGKHFPGHGYAEADSHVDIPRDDRPLEEILARDVEPYRPAIAAGMAGVMPAHVIYSRAAPEPAGYSRFWLGDVLRKRLGFQGLIFSDDLSMAGASTAGTIPERARAALAAGCDMVLLCNDEARQDELLASLAGAAKVAESRVAPMRARDSAMTLATRDYREAADLITALA